MTHSPFQYPCTSLPVAEPSIWPWLVLGLLIGLTLGAITAGWLVAQLNQDSTFGK